MDDGRHSISPDALDARRGAEAVPIVIDVRRDTGFAGAARACGRQRHYAIRPDRDRAVAMNP